MKLCWSAAVCHCTVSNRSPLEPSPAPGAPPFNPNTCWAVIHSRSHWDSPHLHSKSRQLLHANSQLALSFEDGTVIVLLLSTTATLGHRQRIATLLAHAQSKATPVRSEQFAQWSTTRVNNFSTVALTHVSAALSSSDSSAIAAPHR